jgi:acyl-CoA synthetase (AMP-forming)/AMP-acid ligase II
LADRTPGRSIVSTIVQRIHDQPDAVACHSVRHDSDGRLCADAMTFARLDRLIAGAEQRLADIGVEPGDRIVLAVEDPHLLLPWLLATTELGAIAVPLPEPGTRVWPAAAARLTAVCQDCTPIATVVFDPTAWSTAAGQGTGGVLIRADELPEAAASRRGSTEAAPHGPVYLQYTSGSTRAPKGVVVTHANLVANIEACGAAAELGPADTVLSWLPLHHDMGLISNLLLPLHLSMGCYLMRPSMFVHRPVTWLQAVAEYRATITVGPPSAYDLCVRHIEALDTAELDLSRWRLAFVGAEPVPATLGADFTARFAANRLNPTVFYPVYGLAETVLAAAFPKPGLPATYDTVDRDTLIAAGSAVPADATSSRATTFVSVGRAMPGHDIRIVDPESDRLLDERELGEIVLSGPSVTPGYFGHATRPGPLRTGDLGYLAGGDLYVVDRIKDLIIMAGRNFYPADIEATLANFSDVKNGRIAAFATRRHNGPEELAIAVEVSDTTLDNPAATKEAIGRTVRTDFGISPVDVVLVPRGALPRTTSGKVQRRASRLQYEQGLFD